MASVTFKRGTKAEIENTQIQDGQLLMETDQLNNNKIYLDLPNGTRVPVGGSGAWVGTKEEFELAVEEGKIADGTQVIITDDYESGITASMTLYSNAQSGLVATNVQSAIDEVNSNLNSLIKKRYYNYIKPDIDGIFAIPDIDGYIPIFAYIVFPQDNVKTFINIQYNPANHVFYGKSSFGNQGIEVNVIYNKI